MKGSFKEVNLQNISSERRAQILSQYAAHHMQEREHPSQEQRQQVLAQDAAHQIQSN